MPTCNGAYEPQNLVVGKNATLITELSSHDSADIMWAEGSDHILSFKSLFMYSELSRNIEITSHSTNLGPSAGISVNFDPTLLRRLGRP